MKQTEKTVLLLLAVVAIGMFALPSTLAMYTGQHSFVNGSNVNCTTCHGVGDTIYEELNGSDMHTTLGCRDCHGYRNDSLLATPNTDNTTGHAATLGVMCMDCHETLAVTLGINDSDGNGLVIREEFNQTTAAHRDMFNFMNATGDLDKMCIGCHTKISIETTGQIKSNATDYLMNLSEFTYGTVDTP